MDLGLGNATAVVTGGSKGMGRAAAVSLAADGARVAVIARGQDALDATVAEMCAVGSPDAFGISADLGDRVGIETAFATIGERWGSLNVLVNAAGPVDVGIARFDDLTTTTGWRRSTSAP